METNPGGGVRAAMYLGSRENTVIPAKAGIQTSVVHPVARQIGTAHLLFDN